MQGAHINLIQDLGFKPKQAMKLNCDYKAILLTYFIIPVQHDHYSTKYLYRGWSTLYQSEIEENMNVYLFVPNKEQLTNIITKIIFKEIFYESLSKLDIRNLYASTWGWLLVWVEHSFLDLAPY